MHPVQEHLSTLGIDCSIQKPAEYNLWIWKEQFPPQSVNFEYFQDYFCQIWAQSEQAESKLTFDRGWPWK